MRTSGKTTLQQYLKTLDALDCESDALFESIRPALQTIRDNRTAVYLEMLEVLPAPVLYELDRHSGAAMSIRLSRASRPSTCVPPSSAAKLSSR